MLDLSGEKDGSGAGAEGGLGLDVGGEGFEEVIALEEFEHGCRFAAGNDEAIDSIEFFRGSDELRGGAEGGEGPCMGFVCALEGEDADDEGTSCSWLVHRVVLHPLPLRGIPGVKYFESMSYKFLPL